MHKALQVGQWHRRQLLSLVALSGLTSPARRAWANTSGLAEQAPALLPQAQKLGAATYRYFGLAIYDMSLYALAPFKAAQFATVALALELRYARSLSGQAIAERSLAEMRRAAPFDAGREARWLGAMRAAFPDVKEGDRLTGVHDGKGGVQFWFNGKLTHTLQDPEFARLFFGIWLAPTTSEPALRERLLERLSA